MISDTLNQEMKTAMLAKDQVTLRGLRAIKAAWLLAVTEKGPSTELKEEDELRILQKLIKQRRESADIYKQQNREDLAQVEEEEIEVISRFLPKQLGRDEIAAIIDDIIKQSGITSVKDMGKVMAQANKALVGKADGKLIAEIVKEKLA
ncbi:GatB/YqeY domain-containing protein [uncultured Pedobacter sp.]|uniref:GatB/YqeY domain-containing protein n=1 Tax=uncultured Pedobacter sp. TaxID=246139 RepID=UPI0025EF2EFB|nr:GatB/YqeY domain-containing protein [uncultured Pedobacter sp.]